MNAILNQSVYHTRSIWITMAFICLTSTACSSGSDSPVQLDDPPLLDRPEPGVIGDGRLPSILEHIVSDTGIPALTAMFMHQGVIMEQGVAGIRSKGLPESVTVGDKWHLGSLTKSMTSTLVAVLVEQGVVSWSTTIANVFPELIGKMNSAYDDVRLDELLSHTGGIPTSSSKIAEAISSQGGDIKIQRLRFTEVILEEPPAGDRGSHAYSNAGYIVAGAMLERLLGNSWESQLQKYVFEPLGMSGSGFGAPGTAGVNDQPTGHVPDGEDWYSIPASSANADNPAVFGPAGTAHATMSDMAKYMSAHLMGARGLDVPGFLTSVSFARLHEPMPGSAYSLGWDVAESGITHIGSNDRWVAQVIVVPGLEIAVFIATNSGDPETGNGGIPLQALLEVGDLFQRRFEAARSGNQDEFAIPAHASDPTLF